MPFRVNGGERIYEVSCIGIRYINAFEGAVRSSIAPDWSDSEYMHDVDVPADVASWLDELV